MFLSGQAKKNFEAVTYYIFVTVQKWLIYCDDGSKFLELFVQIGGLCHEKQIRFRTIHHVKKCNLLG